MKQAQALAKGGDFVDAKIGRQQAHVVNVVVRSAG